MAGSTSQGRVSTEARRPCNGAPDAPNALFLLNRRVLRPPLKGPIVTSGAQHSNKEMPPLPCVLAGMMVKEFHIPVASSFGARAAALALVVALAPGFAAPAFAQDTQAAPTFASTRAAKASAPQQGGTWYVDMGSDKNTGFVLEQRGSMVLLKVDGSDNVLSLMPVPGQRGDTFFMDYAGRMVLRVTQQGNVVSYIHNASGSPAEPSAKAPPITPGAMTASLDKMRASAASELSKLAGHEVTIWGTQSFSSDEAWAADALNILVLGVKNANGFAGKAASKVEKVTVRRGKAPKVSFKDGELTLDVNPDDGWSGRVTPEAITNSLTQSRNAG